MGITMNNDCFFFFSSSSSSSSRAIFMHWTHLFLVSREQDLFFFGQVFDVDQDVFLRDDAQQTTVLCPDCVMKMMMVMMQAMVRRSFVVRRECNEKWNRNRNREKKEKEKNNISVNSLFRFQCCISCCGQTCICMTKGRRNFLPVMSDEEMTETELSEHVNHRLHRRLIRDRDGRKVHDALQVNGWRVTI